MSARTLAAPAAASGGTMVSVIVPLGSEPSVELGELGLREADDRLRRGGRPGPELRPPHAAMYAPKTPWNSAYALPHTGASRASYTPDSTGKFPCLFRTTVRFSREPAARAHVAPIHAPVPPDCTLSQDTPGAVRHPQAPAAPPRRREAADGARARFRGGRRPRRACRAATFRGVRRPCVGRKRGREATCRGRSRPSSASVRRRCRSRRRARCPPGARRRRRDRGPCRRSPARFARVPGSGRRPLRRAPGRFRVRAGAPVPARGGPRGRARGRARGPSPTRSRAPSPGASSRAPARPGRCRAWTPRASSAAFAARCGLSFESPRPRSVMAASISARRVEKASMTSRGTPAISNRPCAWDFSMP